MANLHVTVERKARLSRKVWVFWLCENILYLNRYSEESRPTARHKFRVDRQYTRVDMRGGVDIPEAEVEIPEDVEAAAIKYVVDSLEVRKWADR